MSGGLKVLALQKDDVTKMLAAGTHLGAANVNFQMLSYVFKKRNDMCVIDVKKTWEKLLLAARVIASIENPADVCVISSRNYGQRAVLKFALHTGATAIAGRFTPGTFTNQIQSAYKEPRLLVVTDPSADHQAIMESSYVNIPVISFCNTDSPTKYVDVKEEPKQSFKDSIMSLYASAPSSGFGQPAQQFGQPAQQFGAVSQANGQLGAQNAGQFMMAQHSSGFGVQQQQQPQQFGQQFGQSNFMMGIQQQQQQPQQPQQQQFNSSAQMFGANQQFRQPNGQQFGQQFGQQGANNFAMQNGMGMSNMQGMQMKNLQGMQSINNMQGMNNMQLKRF